MQGYGVIRGIQGKVRHIRDTLYFDPIEAPGEVADRMQSAANSLDGIQVSMLKRVLPSDSRFAWSLCIPRSKGPDGVNIAFRDGVDESRVVMRWGVRAHVLEHNVL